MYTEDEMQVMESDVVEFSSLADGVVIGSLKADGQVDVDATKRLVARAGGKPCTFHRAIDQTGDLLEAMRHVAQTGCVRVLSSGGAPNALQGAETLAKMQLQAPEIQVIAGGGIVPDNVFSILKKSGVRQIHGSFRCSAHEGTGNAVSLGESDTLHRETSEELVRASVDAMRSI